MIRLERYVHSRRPYAVDPRTLKIVRNEGPTTGGGTWVRWRIAVEAAWHRGKTSDIETCVGTLTWSTREDPYLRWPAGQASISHLERVMLTEGLLTAHRDGRYGGNCAAKLFGGDRLWFADVGAPDALRRYERWLRIAAVAFPSPPVGYSGWWTFQDPSLR